MTFALQSELHTPTPSTVDEISWFLNRTRTYIRTQNYHSKEFKKKNKKGKNGSDCRLSQ